MPGATPSWSVPVLAVSKPLACRASELERTRVELSTRVRPLKVLVAESVSAPPPVTASEPVPEIRPVKTCEAALA